jgi:hypothetical protein
VYTPVDWLVKLTSNGANPDLLLDCSQPRPEAVKGYGPALSPVCWASGAHAPNEQIRPKEFAVRATLTIPLTQAADTAGLPPP